MEISLLLIVAALFVGVLLLKSLIELAVRYALFVAVAVLVFADRYGPDVAAWMDAGRAGEIALIAAAAMIGTKLVAVVFFRRSRRRFLLTPTTGVALTALAARVLAG